MGAPVIAERCSLGELDRPGGSFLQTALWARQKEAFGWKVLPVRWRREEERGTLLILTRSLLPGLSLAYVPHGPVSGAGGGDREDFLVELARELRGVLPLGCFFLRFDPPDYSCGEEPAPRYASPFKKAPLDIQPPDTVVIPLEGEGGRRAAAEELLAGMHKKTRYNIRLAAKKGVCVSRHGRERLADWYALYEVTARRDKIGIHGFSYYERLFRLVEENPGGEELALFLASSEEGELLAGIIVLFRKEGAVYLYGASSNENRHLMPAYALQWEALQRALDKGCRGYDLFGIPPSDDPSHPMHGLYRFKTGFGGEIRRRPGAWDYPYSSLVYGLYTLAEGARRFYHKKWKKRR